jgi:hypothetical protein
MNRNDSRPVLKTSGAGDSLAEFNYLVISKAGAPVTEAEQQVKAIAPLHP